MKMLLVVCSAAALALGVVRGQSPQIPAPAPVAAPPLVPPDMLPPPMPVPADLLDVTRLSAGQFQAVARFQMETVTRILGVQLHIDGVLPEMARARRPLQWINPMAPAGYGRGLENVSTNPRTGRMEGITFLSFRF